MSVRNSTENRKHVLIVGSGSVGKRHAENFSNLGCDVSSVDPRLDRRNEMRLKFGAKNVYANLAAALAENTSFTGVVICSPPKWHIEQTLESVKKRLPVFLEKPPAKDLHSAMELQKFLKNSEIETNNTILMGYTWRWWPALRYLHDVLAQGLIGAPYFARFHVSANLADWHPWEDYREFFMSSADLGGGALLDESHWLDQMLWFFGMPNSIFGTVDKVSDLEITSDDCVEILAYFDDGLRVSLHLDTIGRPHEKSISIYGRKGFAEWSEKNNTVDILDENGKRQTKMFNDERNYMFLCAAKEFFDLMNGASIKTCSLQDGINVMSLIDNVRCSNAHGETVKVPQ